MAKDFRISLLLDFYGEMLTKKQREVIDFYYNDDLSLSEIAENEGITRQGIRDAIKHAESQLWAMENRLGLARRFRKMTDGIEQIRAAAEQIRDYNEHTVFAREIDRNVRQILEITRRLCK